jgi:GT2 family glycosyltransferase
VYLIDNGSSDGSIEFVEKHFPWVKIMAFEKNFGFAKAYNRAINECGAELIALLNNDTRVNRRWLQELVKVMSRDKSTIIVGSKLLLYDSPQLLNHAGAKIASIGGGFDVGLYEKDSVEYNVEKPVGAVCGAAMLFKKELFKRIGGFDEDFFAYFEDIDLCWRSWLYGYKVIYVPTSVVYHKLGGSWGRTNPEKAFLCQRNRIVSILKNFELRNILTGLLGSVIYDFTRVIESTLKKRVYIDWIIFEGYIDVMFNLSCVLQKRKTVQSGRILTDKELYSMGLIASFRDGFHEFMRFRSRKY